MGHISGPSCYLLPQKPRTAAPSNAVNDEEISLPNRPTCHGMSFSSAADTNHLFFDVAQV